MQSSSFSVVRSAGRIGFLTGLSRVLGFVRDVVIAAAFGTGLGAEAFVVSFKIPNLLRDLVGEGAASSAFVPVLTECREKEPAEFWRLVSTLFFVMAGILLLLTALGMGFAPFVVRLVAPGFLEASDPEKFPLTVTLTRTIFPYIFLIGLSALAMGVLHSLGEFTPSALGPPLLNISMIISGAFFQSRYGPMALVAGVLAGGVLQLGCQIPALYERGFRLVRPQWGLGRVGQILSLLIPRALGSALYQLNVFVDTILASFESIVGPGGQSALYYSNRLFQLPLAIFGVSLAQAVLPSFSSQAARQDMKSFKETLAASLRGLSFAILPASVGLWVLSEPIVRIVFERGRFDAASTAVTSGALFFYAWGLLSCALIKILANAFYAMQDTRTPVRTMAVSVVLNILLCLLLMRPLKVGGLALASSISATVNAVLLYGLLRKKVGPFGGAFWPAFLKSAQAAAGMGSVVFVYDRFILQTHAHGVAAIQGVLLLAGVLLGMAAYFALALLLGAEEARSFWKWVRH